LSRSLRLGRVLVIAPPARARLVIDAGATTLRESTRSGGPKKATASESGKEAWNPLRMWSLRLGLPSPPYTRGNAIIVETIGRRSGKRRRVPVGFLEEDDKLIVVAEDGLASS